MSEEMTNTKGAIFSQCNKCKNHIFGVKCSAFDIIPDSILKNEHDHKKPYPGDNGIKFEALKNARKS